MQRLCELKLWKKRPVCVFTLLLFLFVFLLTVFLVRPCKEYEFEGSYSFVPGTAVTNVVIYEGIHLKPGVYRIELEYETDTDLSALCNVADGTVFWGGLRSNGESLYSASGKTGFHIWLYESTENLQVVVSYHGTGRLTTAGLKVVETNGLWTMLLSACVLVGAIYYGAAIFYYWNKRYPVEAEKKNVFFCITLIGFVISIPYICGYTIDGADLIYHLQRIEGVKDGLLGGQFPVRIAPEWLYGYGYPDAVFYCNILLYFPALLRLLGFSVTTSYNIYCIALNFATAWISYYCFSRMFGKWKIGVICSALYTLSIFRIYKLIGTSAVGEASAITFLPLVLYGLYRIFAENPKNKQYKTAWIPVMLGYAGLMQTHVLTCEITALVTLLFCLIYIRKIFCLNTFLELAKGAVGAVLVSLWFLVPFLDYYMTQDVHIKHVWARTIQDRGLYPAHLAFHFWATGSQTPLGNNGMKDSHPVGIGLILIVALIVFLIFWFTGAFRKLERKRLTFAKVTAFIGLLLLFMSLNCFPWDRIQNMNSLFASLVSSIQFPNRFLGWGTTCLVMLFGFLLAYFESFDKRLFHGLAALAVICVLTSGMYLLDYMRASRSFYELYNEEGMGCGYISGAEYLIEGTENERLTFADAVPGKGVNIYSYSKGCLRGELECENPTKEDSYVDVPLLLYKGYQAVDAATGTCMQISAGENNVVRVWIPSGYRGNVTVWFESPVYWRISEWVSLITVLAMPGMGWRHRRMKTC